MSDYEIDQLEAEGLVGIQDASLTDATDDDIRGALAPFLGVDEDAAPAQEAPAAGPDLDAAGSAWAELVERQPSATEHSGDIAALISTRRDLFPTSSPEEMGRSFELGLALARSNRFVTAGLDSAKQSAYELAQERLADAVADEDVVAALEEASASIGFHDPLFRQLVAEEVDEIDRDLVGAWVFRSEQEAATAEAEARAADAALAHIERLVEVQQEREAFETAAQSALADLTQADDFDELMPMVPQFLEQIPIEEPQDVKPALERALLAARETVQVARRNTFRDAFLHEALGTGPNFRDDDGNLVLPEREREAPDLARATPQPSRLEQRAAFSLAFERATASPTEAFRVEVDRKAVAAEKHAQKEQRRTGRRPR